MSIRVSLVIGISMLLWSRAFATTSVVSVTPNPNSENAAVSSSITIVFSDQIDTSTVSSASVMIIGSTTGYRSFTKSYFAGTKTLTLTPTTQFRYGERIQVVLTDSVKDQSANAIIPYTFSFQTLNTGGYGTFAQSSVSWAGNTPEGIGTADLDGDGDLDIIVASYYSDSVLVYSNNGSGALTRMASIYIGSLPQAVPMATGDFDRDGDMDVVVPSRGSGNLVKLRNNGSWSFTASNISIGGNPIGVTAGDIDSDGDLDLVAANLSNVKIILNDGTGTLSVSNTLSPSGSPLTPLLVDIEGDGDLDLAVSRYSASSVIVYTNNGSAVFSSSNTFTTGSSPRTVETADFNRDGYPDLVVANSSSNTVTVLTNSGAGSFTPADISAGTIPHTATPIDADGDADQDLIISNGLILLNNGSGSFTQSGTSATHEYPVTGDFDGDGDADIARISNTQMAVRILLNDYVAPTDNALSLNGSTAYIDLPESATMTTFGNRITIEAQVKLNSLPSGNACSILNSGNQTDYAMMVNPNGTVWVRVYTSNGPASLDLTSKASLCSGQWYHLAYVYDSTTAMLYIDGNLDTMRLQTGAVGNSPQQEFIAVGACYYSGQYMYFFDGKVDELRLWNVARTSTQLNQHLYGSLPASDRSGLVGYWRFEGNYADSSGNGNGGAAAGSATRSLETVTRGVVVQTPNGSETWSVGSTHAITWSSSGVSFVKIEYSIDAGVSWNTVVSSVTASTGMYNWTVPNTQSSSCKVRISNVSCSGTADLSDAWFTITPPARTVQLGIFNTASTDLELRIKPTDDFMNMTLDSLRFTIRWLDSYGVSLGTASSPTYSLTKLGTEYVSGIYRYQRFSAATGQQITWSANVEYAVLTIPVVQTGSGTGTFEVVNDSWTISNWGNYSISLDGTNWTGNYYHGSAIGVPLPIELVSFSGVYDAGAVRLSWETMSELNNFNFLVERNSTSDALWAVVGSVPGHGSTDSKNKYEFVDNLTGTAIPGSTVRYRLKQVDRDGSFNYYGPLLVITSVEPAFRMEPNYPNPFSDGTTVQMSVPSDCYIDIAITDINGRTVYEEKGTVVTRGVYQKSVRLNQFIDGTYLCNVTAYSRDGHILNSNSQKMVLLKSHRR